MNLKSVFMNRQLVEALHKTKDVASIVQLVHIIANKELERVVEEEEEHDKEEGDDSYDFPGRFLTSVVGFRDTRGMIEDVLKVSSFTCEN